MTVDEMVAETCGPLSYNSSDTTHIARAVRWLNQACKDMSRHDWPELITVNASFTTNGNESYDLSNSSYAGTTFQRVIDNTVRIGTRYLALRTKAWFDMVDPNRSLTGYATHYALVKRTDFRLFPAESSGSTCYYDWVKIPATLASGGAEATCTFYPERHDLIVEGAIWRGLRFIGDTESDKKKMLWEQAVSDAFKKSGLSQVSRFQITHINF